MDDTDTTVATTTCWPFRSSKSKSSKRDKADAVATPNRPQQQQNYQTQISKKPIISRPTTDDTYNNDNPRMGIAVVFNHKIVKGQKERVGTEKDRDTVVEMLQTYGFDTRVFNDLTFEKVNTYLKEIAQEDHSNNDCFLLVVMSHGSEGKVYASDMSYPVERLWQPFLGEKCKSLINKPKLFFVQACRGQNLDQPVVFETFSVMSRASFPAAQPTPPPIVTYAIPSTADMLVMYSTFEKHYSFRNVENGSWFIQSLCNVFNDAAKSPAASEEGVELLSLLTAVNRMVAYEYQSTARQEVLNEMKEMPNFMSTLTKAFYLKVKPNSVYKDETLYIRE